MRDLQCLRMSPIEFVALVAVRHENNHCLCPQSGMRHATLKRLEVVVWMAR